MTQRVFIVVTENDADIDALRMIESAHNLKVYDCQDISSVLGTTVQSPEYEMWLDIRPSDIEKEPEKTRKQHLEGFVRHQRSKGKRVRLLLAPADLKSDVPKESWRWVGNYRCGLEGAHTMVDAVHITAATGECITLSDAA